MAPKTVFDETSSNFEHNSVDEVYKKNIKIPPGKNKTEDYFGLGISRSGLANRGSQPLL